MNTAKKLLASFLFLACFVIGLNAKDNIHYGFINVAKINVRSQPTTSSHIITGLSLYTPVEIVGDGGRGAHADWIKIKLFDDSIGYVYGKYVTILKNDFIPHSLLEKSDLQLKVPEGEDLAGVLLFSVDKNKVDVFYRVVIPSWIEGGGSGTADTYSNTGTYNPRTGTITMDGGDNFPIIYDARNGLLLFGYYLWNTK